MKKILSALLPLFSLTVSCQAEPLHRHFIVEFEQWGGSPGTIFSVKPVQPAFSDHPSYLAVTNGYAESVLPPDDKPQKLGDYGVKTTFYDSISWQLIYATHLPFVCELVLATHNADMSVKPSSSLPLGALFAVGWLMDSYWNPDSPLFNPMGQLEASQVHPFAITTMMLPGQGQGKKDQQNPPSSSGQQASGAAAQITGFFTSPTDFGSGDGNENPEQQQHTLCFNCFVDSCNGVCKHRPSPDGDRPAEWGPNPGTSSTGCARVKHEQILPSGVKTRERARQMELLHLSTKKRRVQERISVIDRLKECQILLAHEIRAEEKARKAGVTPEQNSPSASVVPFGQQLTDWWNPRDPILRHQKKRVVLGQLKECELRLAEISAEEIAESFKIQNELLVCDLRVVEEGQQVLCGKAFNTAQALSDHKRKQH
ncbi:hypothetical protein [Endozoicomonas sp. 8E]|uniref:hypothetical protein n=1 Tax=Endozoicomonas sp. 8E TaxID=3035692 RepID=UPI002938F79F|nr:hypothetical protein [Endozoicomonas sp. 8E]WOG28481.1 hypothetical protein P6910_02160 [Endozoicomonas sp. 8E]